jgi:anti-sigma B factor antagonist
MSSFYVIGDDAVIEDVVMIAVGGELDLAVSPQLRERMFARIAAGYRKLLLDFSEVTFIDSSAIGAIVGAVSRLRTSGGGAVAVVCPGGEDSMAVEAPERASNVRTIFRITGIDAGVALCSSREEALAQLSAAA